MSSPALGALDFGDFAAPLPETELWSPLSVQQLSDRGPHGASWMVWETEKVLFKMAVTPRPDIS